METRELNKEGKNEEMRLKIKINRLIDTNEELKKENEKLKVIAENLKKSIMLLEETNPMAASMPEVNTYKYLIHMYDLLQHLKVSDLIIPAKNMTPITKEFYRVEKTAFESVIASMLDPELDSNKLLKLMVNLGVLRKVENKVVFAVTAAGAPKRVYMIKKTAIDLPEIAI